MDGGKRQFFGVPGNHWRGFKIADDARGPVIDPNTMEREISREKLVAARAYMRMRSGIDRCTVAGKPRLPV